MKKFNQMTEKQMSAANGGVLFPLIIGGILTFVGLPAALLGATSKK